MATPCEKLKQSLTVKSYEKRELTNKRLYQEMMQISEASFYCKYKGQMHVMRTLLEMAITETLVVQKGDNFERFIDRALKKIKQEKSLYQNIYTALGNESSTLSEVAINLATQNLKKYPDLHRGIARRDLENVSKNIYKNIFYWIQHDCKEPVIDIYSQLKVFFPVFEGHRCSFRPSYQKRKDDY